MREPDDDTNGYIDPEELFSEVAAERDNDRLLDKLITATIRYYQSPEHTGYIIQVDTETGERRIGTFENGIFSPVEIELLADRPVGREFGGPDCEYD